MIIRKTPEEIERMAAAGAILVRTLRLLEGKVREGVCDIDGSKLIQRKDDSPAVVEKRLKVYHEETEPIVEPYDAKGVLKRFDGTRPPTEVHDHLRATIATLRLEDEL